MRGHDLRNFCRDLLGHIRDLLVVKVSGDPKLLDSSSALASALQQQAANFSESDLVRFFHALAETEANLKDAANPRYQVEVALVKLMEMRRLASLGDLVARIAELESALRAGRAPAERKNPQTAPAIPSNAAGRSAPATSTRTASASDVASSPPPLPVEVATETSPEPAAHTAAPSGSIGDQIKAELERKKRKLLAAAIGDAARVDLNGEEITIEFSPAAKHSRDTMAKSDNVKILREACAAVCGRDVGIRFAIHDSENNDLPLSPDEDRRRSKQQARQAAAQNPTVQQVLKTFGGEIVDVKTT
jgi:DNA polymerase-3 subunit gamma/tau